MGCSPMRKHRQKSLLTASNLLRMITAMLNDAVYQTVIAVYLMLCIVGINSHDNTLAWILIVFIPAHSILCSMMRIKDLLNNCKK